MTNILLALSIDTYLLLIISPFRSRSSTHETIFQDEALCPRDYQQAGVLRDDEVLATLVAPLRELSCCLGVIFKWSSTVFNVESRFLTLFQSSVCLSFQLPDVV